MIASILLVIIIIIIIIIIYIHIMNVLAAMYTY